MKKKATYKESGVDIKKADRFVRSIARMNRSLQKKSGKKLQAPFGSLYPLELKKYRQPVLVSSSDGVGTKLMVAHLVGRHDSVGIDCVAMNVNDILCCGARPLFFLDYIACGRLRPKILNQVMRSVIEGCRQAGCLLLGGETAEMPGIYHKDDYDLAGFACGIVERGKIVDGSRIKKGDLVLGLASSGPHSNGFSLLRKVLSKKQKKQYASAILEPTRIYVKPVVNLFQKYSLKGMAHITGGAFYEKLGKIIPRGLCARIDISSWEIPEIFQVIQKQGNITKREMFSTFNMGIGFVCVVASSDAKKIQRSLSRQKVASWVIGEIIINKIKRIVL